MDKSKKISIVFTVLFVVLVAVTIYIVIAMCKQINDLNAFYENRTNGLPQNPENLDYLNEINSIYIKEKTAFVTTLSVCIINIFIYTYLWLNFVLQQKFAVLCNNLKLKSLLTFQNIKLILSEQKKIKKQEKIDKLKNKLEKLNKE